MIGKNLPEIFCYPNGVPMWRVIVKKEYVLKIYFMVFNKQIFISLFMTFNL